MDTKIDFHQPGGTLAWAFLSLKPLARMGGGKGLDGSLRLNIILSWAVKQPQEHQVDTKHEIWTNIN